MRKNIESTKIPLKLGFKLEYTQKGDYPIYTADKIWSKLKLDCQINIIR